MPDTTLLANLNKKASDEVLLEFKDYIDALRRTLFPQIGENEEQRLQSAAASLDHIFEVANKASKETPLSVDGIIHEFREKAANNENILELVRNYAAVVASTCAQAPKIVKYSTIASNKAKYVIVDEAARVNPLELINAILMGIKVILVGDQMQLPQYLEAQAVARYEKDGG